MILANGNFQNFLDRLPCTNIVLANFEVDNDQSRNYSLKTDDECDASFSNESVGEMLSEKTVELTQGPSKARSSETCSSLTDGYSPHPIPLSRFASFSGFETTPLGHSETTSPMCSRMRSEKRRTIAESFEFKRLREVFVHKFIDAIVHRTAHEIP